MTQQIPDSLIVDDESFALVSDTWLPASHSRILDVGLARSDDSILQSSMCWRGYVATWQVHQGHVFLMKIDGRYRLDDGPGLFADWLTTDLRAATGDWQRIDAMHQMPVTARCYEVRAGVVVVTYDERYDPEHGYVRIAQPPTELPPAEADPPWIPPRFIDETDSSKKEQASRQDNIARTDDEEDEEEEDEPGQSQEQMDDRRREESFAQFTKVARIVVAIWIVMLLYNCRRQELADSERYSRFQSLLIECECRKTGTAYASEGEEVDEYTCRYYRGKIDIDEYVSELEGIYDPRTNPGKRFCPRP